jgi:hypothetical protein
VTIIAVATLAYLRQGKSRRVKNFLNILTPAATKVSSRSLIDQLDEFQRFSRANIIPKDRRPAFKKALYEQWRKLYKIPVITPAPKSLPELPEELTNLIGKLISQTEQGHLQWKVQYDNEGVMDSSRFSADVYPQGLKNALKGWSGIHALLGRMARAVVGRSGTKVMAKFSLRKQDPLAPRSRIEIYQTDTGPGMAIYNADGIIIKVIDRETFSIPEDVDAQLRKLHEVTKDYVFKVKQTLEDILTNLGVDPKSPPSEVPKNPPGPESGAQKTPDN